MAPYRYVSLCPWVYGTSVSFTDNSALKVTRQYWQQSVFVTPCDSNLNHNTFYCAVITFLSDGDRHLLVRDGKLEGNPDKGVYTVIAFMHCKREATQSKSIRYKCKMAAVGDFNEDPGMSRPSAMKWD